MQTDGLPALGHLYLAADKTNLFFRHQNKSARYVQSNPVHITKSENAIESVSINGPYLVG